MVKRNPILAVTLTLGLVWTSHVPAAPSVPTTDANQPAAEWQKYLGFRDLTDFHIRSVARRGALLYLLGDLSADDGHDDVIAWSPFSRRVKAHFPLQGSPSEMAYSKAHDALYLSYEDLESSEPVRLTRIALDARIPAEEIFLALGPPRTDEYFIYSCGVEAAGDYLAVCARTGSFWYNGASQVIVRDDGTIADQTDTGPAERLTYSPANSALYYLVTHPFAHITYHDLAADGSLTDSGIQSAPLSSSMPLAVSESGTMLAKGTGPLLDARTLTPLEAFERPPWADVLTRVQDLVWDGDERILARTYDPESRTRLWFTDVRTAADGEGPVALDVTVSDSVAAVHPLGRHAVVLASEESGPRIRFVRAPRSEAPKRYCPSRAHPGTNAWIAQVAVHPSEVPPGDLPVSDSGPERGYGDHTETSFHLFAGPGAMIEGAPTSRMLLRPGYRSGGEQALYWGVWLDENRDGHFSDDEQVHQGRHTGTVSVPISGISANTGATRMRVVTRADEPPRACGRYRQGETEDYTVTVQWF